MQIRLGPLGWAGAARLYSTVVNHLGKAYVRINESFSLIIFACYACFDIFSSCMRRDKKQCVMLVDSAPDCTICVCFCVVRGRFTTSNVMKGDTAAVLMCKHTVT